MRVEELSGPELRHLLAGTAMAVADVSGKGGPIEELERMLRRCGELYRALKKRETVDAVETAIRTGAVDGAGEQQGEGGAARASAHSSPPGTAPH